VLSCPKLTLTVLEAAAQLPIAGYQGPYFFILSAVRFQVYNPPEGARQGLAAVAGFCPLLTSVKLPFILKYALLLSKSTAIPHICPDDPVALVSAQLLFDSL